MYNLTHTQTYARVLAVKMILLHETKNDEGIRLFFLDVWEAYVKVSLTQLSDLGSIPFPLTHVLTF